MHACDWPCNWVKWGLPGKCLHTNVVTFCTCVSNGERQMYKPTRKRVDEWVNWVIFFYARLEKDREAEWFEAFAMWGINTFCWPSRAFCSGFGCTCGRRFNRELWGHWPCEFCWHKCRKSLHSSCLRAWFSSSLRQILWLHEMDSD